MMFVKSLAVAALALAPLVASADTLLKMESFPATGASGQVGIAISQMASKYTDIDMQVSVGKSAPKQIIAAATGKADITGLPPMVAFFMKNQQAMFKEVKQAPQLLGNMRSLINYPIGSLHIVVFEDSGIRELSDLKGKRVFLGPPASAAAHLNKQLLQIATGLKADEDYEVLPFDWQSAVPAFMDRQVDVHFAPTQVPSANIEQIALISDIRLLAVPDATYENPAFIKLMKTPSLRPSEIPSNTYKNQVNETPVRTTSAWTGFGAGAHVDEEVIYKVVKAFWENLDEVHATAPWMSVITKDTVFNEMVAPLHAGAYRYYVEAGFEVPEALIPPEAK